MAVKCGGRGPGHSNRRPKKAGAVAPVLTTLPTVTTSPNLVGGAYKAVSGYSGALIRIVNSTNTASQDISAGADGYVDTAAILAFYGGGSIDGIKIDIVYDQTGNGNNLTQTTDASRPVLSLGVNGKPAITFTETQGMAIPAGYTMTSQALSFFMLGRYCRGAIFQSNTSATSIFQQATTIGLRLAFGNTTRTVSTNHYQNRAVTHLSSSAAALKIGQDGTLTATAAAASATTLTGGLLGNSSNASSQMVGEMEVFAFYPAALSGADMGTVTTAMKSMGGAISAKTKQLVLIEDSLTAGTGATFNRNRTWYITQAIGDQTLVFERGKGGRQLSAVVSTDYTPSMATIYNAGMSKNVMAVLGGINDIVGGGASGATLTTTFQSFATLANATGWQWLAYDLPAYNAAEPARSDFNTWLDANYGTYASAKVDLRASSIGGGQPSFPAYYFDAVHPNSAGYQVWATYELNNGIKTALGIA